MKRFINIAGVICCLSGFVATYTQEGLFFELVRLYRMQQHAVKSSVQDRQIEALESNDEEATISAEEALQLLVIFIQAVIMNLELDETRNEGLFERVNEAVAGLIGAAIDVSWSAYPADAFMQFHHESDVQAFFDHEVQDVTLCKQWASHAPVGYAGSSHAQEVAHSVLSTAAHVIAHSAQIAREWQKPEIVGQSVGAIIGSIVQVAQDLGRKSIIEDEQEFRKVAVYLLDNKDLHSHIAQLLVDKE